MEQEIIIPEARSTPPPSFGSTTKSVPGCQKIPADILDDLASRFIINVPDDERNNLIRICFQIELAHWFYLDFFCSIDDKKLIHCGIKQFAMHLFQHIPFLRIHLSKIDEILDTWKQYKMSVPTYGAILMSEGLEYVLLVQSFWAKSSWGFPKGKVNEHEDPVHCATREVFEETGYDITELIVPTQYIESIINDQYTRLYLVRNVPLKTLFTPRTRKEIKCIEWFPIDSLPANKNDTISKINGMNPNSFFMIMPFVKRLKKWVQDNRTGGDIIKSRNSGKKIEQRFANENVPPINIERRKSSCKRQRHKSLSDIDGIKVNLSVNNMTGGMRNSCAKGYSYMTTGINDVQRTTSNSLSSSSSSSYNHFISTKPEHFHKMNLKRQVPVKSCNSIPLMGNSINCLTTIRNNYMKCINTKKRQCTTRNTTTNNSVSKDANFYIPTKKDAKPSKICKGLNSIYDIDVTNNTKTLGPCFDSWRRFTFDKQSITDVFA